MCRHDDERHDSRFASDRLQAVVEAGQRFDEHIHTLIPELISASREEVKRVFRVEIVMSVEVAAHKIVYLLLGLLVQVLELVHGRELGHVQTIGQHTVGFALEQVFALEGRDVRYGGENVTAMSSSALNAVPMVDTPLSCLRIYVEPLQVVVEINGAGAKVSAQKSCVRRKDSGDIYAPPLA